MLAANIAADLQAWCRLLGLHDQEDLKDAGPETLRFRLWHLPARFVRHARKRVLKISSPAGTQLTSGNRHCTPGRRTVPARVKPVLPGHAGRPATTTERQKRA